MANLHGNLKTNMAAIVNKAYWHPILSRVIDMIRQSFFIMAGNKEINVILAVLKLIFQNYFFGKIYPTAHRFKICKNKKLSETPKFTFTETLKRYKNHTEDKMPYK